MIQRYRPSLSMSLKGMDRMTSTGTMCEWSTELQEWRSGRCERHLRLKRESQRCTETRVLKRVELGMLFLLENTLRHSHYKVPVFKFAQSLTTNMTNFCSQLFLALAESVSVKWCCIKDVTCVLFFVLPLMKPHKVWGETFGDQKHYRLVCWDCMKKETEVSLNSFFRIHNVSVTSRDFQSSVT